MIQLELDLNITTKHKPSQIQCLVYHTDDNGNKLPQCIKCKICGEFVRPEDFMTEKCKGDKWWIKDEFKI